MPQERKRPSGSRAEKMRAVASPVRLEIIERLQTGGAKSIAELAALMDRRSDTLYHHVRKLMRAGVLVAQGRRETGHRPGVVYALASAKVALAHRAGDRSDATAANQAAAAVLRLALRDFRAALDAGDVCGVEGERRLMVSRHKAWLTPSGLAGLNRRLAELQRFLLAQSARRKGRLCALTVVLTPLEAYGSGRGER